VRRVESGALLALDNELDLDRNSRTGWWVMRDATADDDGDSVDAVLET
jgi:hypothetical protein